MSGGRETRTVQSLVRAFTILEHVAHEGPVGLSLLAERADLPVPTIHRLIRTLVDIGYVRQDGARRYYLGPRAAALATGAQTAIEIVARPLLAGLVTASGETANLAVLDGRDIVYLAQVPSQHGTRTFTEVGRRVPAHTTAVGKALLARLTPNQVNEILGEGPLPVVTDATIGSVPKLQTALKQIRRLGYAVDEGEQEVGVRCVAVATADLPYAFSISGPSSRLSPGCVEECVPLLKQAAEELHLASVRA